jgi:hypothetical protein
MMEHKPTSDEPHTADVGGPACPEPWPEPVERLAEGSVVEPACPFCNSTHTVVVSPFGSQLLMSQRQCQTCRSYFEALRDDR